MVRKVTKVDIIQQYVNDYGKRYYLRELASSLDKSHQTIKPHVETLVKDDVLIKKKRGKIIEYRLNFTNNKIYDYLIIAEKRKLIERLEKDTMIKILFDRLAPFFIKNTFIIFGSSADKTRKGSDIDILIIGKSSRKKVIRDFEEVYNKKIHMIETNHIEQLTPTFVKEIYKNHLIFNNTEQVIRFFGDRYEKNKMV